MSEYDVGALLTPPPPACILYVRSECNESNDARVPGEEGEGEGEEEEEEEEEEEAR